ncbi:MAG: stage 0 sporulation family protein [Clostridia bacterium]|nr:stage 0 sporulation family protein [Clostridia bacterium]
MENKKTEKATPAPATDEKVEIVGINFREAGKIYYFSPAKIKFSEGDRVIVDTARGTEMGTVKIPNKLVPASDIVSPLKEVTRLATKEDISRDEKNHEMEFEAALICKKKIAAHGLGMRLVGVEYTFDNSKLLFYFTCESRVDFRELVKDLASTFRTRIELRQIGIRDAAKLMGGIGVCGRKYCCSGFLSDFVQVTIKMAKEQNFSLNSAKVSGACGRLMCCLRYEHEAYEYAISVTPPVGSVVLTSDGEGVVTEIKPLAKEVRVKLNDTEKDVAKIYKVADLKILRTPKKNKNKSEDDENEEFIEN